MNQVTCEDEVLERLSVTRDPRAFFQEVGMVIEENADHLLRGAFRQEEYAVKYAIEPLLNRHGPLSELTVRLRLMLGLGMLAVETFEDLERMIKLRDWLTLDIRNYRFSDEVVMQRLKRLHSLQRIGLPPLPPLDPESDHQLYLMQLDRQDQMVQSALQLAVSATVLELARESPI